MFKLSDPIIEKPADTEPTNTEIIAEIKKTSKRCLRVARKKGNELDMPGNWNVGVSVKRRGRRSTGGGGFSAGWIIIVTDHHMGNTTLANEYAAIRNDPAIGEFHSANWRLRINKVVCHEVAHAIQHLMRARQVRGYLDGWKANVDWRKPHGQGWRRLYAMLRREIVNPYI